MKITVSKSELFSKLNALGRIIQSKNTLSAFDNFLFIVDEEGLLKVVAGEEGGRLSTNIECETDFASVSFMIDAKTILDGCRDIPEQPLIIEIVESPKYFNICVRYSNGKFELVGGLADEYPAMELMNVETPFLIPTERFLYGIRQAQICCANDELRPVLNGLFVDRGVDSITYVSSDGASLGMVEDSYPSSERSSFIIPGRMTKILSKIIPSTLSDIIVTVGSGNVSIEFGCYIMTCRLIEGCFPNYRSVIPSNNNKTAVFNKNDMLSALKRVSVFCNESSSLVVMKFENDKVVLSGHNIDFSSSAEEEMPLSYSGDSLEIGFKSSMLIELLSNVPSSEVIMTMKEASRAALLTRSDNTDLTYLIMPLIINN